MGEAVGAGVHGVSEASVGVGVASVMVSDVPDKSRMIKNATASTATAAPPMISAIWRAERPSPSRSGRCPPPEAEADLRWAT